jgi:hypothetical protein
MYVNGVLGGSDTNDVSVPAAEAPLTIGQAQELLMDGMLDEISVYNRALAMSEILAIYQAGADGKCGLFLSAIELAARLGSGGTLTLEIRGGRTGATFTIQATSDFKQWTNLGQVPKAQDVTTFTDTTPNRPPWRYYRVVTAQ